jgi:hypothetical protein
MAGLDFDLRHERLNQRPRVVTRTVLVCLPPVVLIILALWLIIR